LLQLSAPAFPEWMAPKPEETEYNIIRWCSDLLLLCVLTLIVYWVQGMVLDSVDKFLYLTVFLFR